MALITTHHLTCTTMYYTLYTVYIRSYTVLKAVEAMYILLLYHHHKLCNSCCCDTECHLAKNYDIFQDTTPKC